MPSFTNSYTEPGTYVVINDDVSTQTNTGLLSVCIIGTGTNKRAVNNLELTLVPPTDTSLGFYTALSSNASISEGAYVSWVNASNTTSYYECTVSNVCPDISCEASMLPYLAQNYKVLTTTDTDGWASPLDTTYPVVGDDLPTYATGAITTKKYPATEVDGSSTVTNFTIDVQSNKFIWNHSRISQLAGDKNANNKYQLGISYNSVKSTEDYKIKSFTRLSNIFATYGAPSAENTISSAAQIAYDNGATVFYCVQPDPEIYTSIGGLTEAGLSKGLTEARKVDTYCIVPMIAATTSNTVAAKCKAHVENMSTTLERKERIVIIAGPGTIEAQEIDDAVATYKSLAAGVSSSRVICLAPARVGVSADTFSTASADGMYAAAALAGIICNNNYTCGEPISGKTLADITIDDRYTREEKNQMAAYGCLVIEGAEGTSIPKLRHALSTATGDYIKSEIKITKIKDVISSTLRLAMDKAYINTRFVGAQTISEMTSTVSTILSSFMANNDIISYSNLIIAQNTSYPNQVDISFKIRPSVDVNYILITFGVSFDE